MPSVRYLTYYPIGLLANSGKLRYREDVYGNQILFYYDPSAGRLSKLILACVVSKEVQADLEQWLCARIRTIGTTAFTDKPISMKYRGIFDVHSRTEGKVNYLGAAGQWSLKEGFLQWKLKHSIK